MTTTTTERYEIPARLRELARECDEAVRRGLCVNPAWDDARKARHLATAKQTRHIHEAKATRTRKLVGDIPMMVLFAVWLDEAWADLVPTLRGSSLEAAMECFLAGDDSLAARIEFDDRHGERHEDAGDDEPED